MADEPTQDLLKSLEESPVLPVLPLRNTLLFPDMVIPLAVGRERSLKAVEAATRGDGYLLIISQKDMEQLLEAGRYTPTGTNSQGIEYIVINDPDKIAQLGKMTMPAVIRLFGMAVRVSRVPILGSLLLGEQAAENFQNIYTPAIRNIDEYTKRGDDRLFYHAPAIILVHGEKLDDMAFSCSAALFSCMLMADSLGIGCCLNGFLVLAANRDPKVKKWLGIPRNHKAHAAMTLGYTNVKYNHLVKRNPVSVKYL